MCWGNISLSSATSSDQIESAWTRPSWHQSLTGQHPRWSSHHLHPIHVPPNKLFVPAELQTRHLGIHLHSHGPPRHATHLPAATCCSFCTTCAQVPQTLSASKLLPLPTVQWSPTWQSTSSPTSSLSSSSAICSGTLGSQRTLSAIGDLSSP